MKELRDYLDDIKVNYGSFIRAKEEYEDYMRLSTRTWKVRIAPTPENGLKEVTWVDHPNPLTPGEQARYAAYHEPVSGCLRYQQYHHWQEKLLRETPIIHWLVMLPYDYLKENCWAWPIQAKDLVQKGWLIAKNRVRFEKTDEPVGVGTLFRNPAGMGHTIYHITSKEPHSRLYTFERAYLTNYGYPLIAPPSRRPVRIDIEDFLQRGFRFVSIVADEPAL